MGYAKLIKNYSPIVSSTAPGLAPQVPTSISSTAAYLRADGTWVIPPDNNTTYTNATTTAAGLLPKLGGGTTNYLRADGSWATPTNTTYASLKNPNALTLNVYSGTSSPTATTYDGGSTKSASVASASAITNITRSGVTFTATRANGGTFTFTQQDSNTTYGTVSTNAAGLAPKVTSTAAYLRGDGSWATPTNTTYSLASEQTDGLINRKDFVQINNITSYMTYYPDPDGALKPDTHFTYTDYGTKLIEHGRWSILYLNFSSTQDMTNLTTLFTLNYKFGPMFDVSVTAVPNTISTGNAPYIQINTDNTVKIGNYKGSVHGGVRIAIPFIHRRIFYPSDEHWN